MFISSLLIFLISFFLGSFFIILFTRISLKHNFLSIKGMPHTGGIAMGLSFAIACLSMLLVLKNSHQLILGILASSLVMLFFGTIDDLIELSVWQKFLVQAVAVSLLILLGVRTKIIYIGYAANIIITSLWVIGITNAFNHLDIIDGLAGGTAAIISLAFFIVTAFSKNMAVAFLCSALMGIVVSFLTRNFPPAKVYMGNTGSHFLGFVLAGIAIAISYAPSSERKIALLCPLLIMGLPIFDTIFLILIRAGKGKIPFRKSNDHLALRLVEMGYSKRKALLYMLAVSGFFCIAGIILIRVSNIIGSAIILTVITVSLLITKKAGRSRLAGKAG